MYILIFLSMAMMLVTGKSYNYMPAVVVAFSLGKYIVDRRKKDLLRNHQGCTLLKENENWRRYAVWTLFLYFAVHLLYMLVFQEKFKVLDNAYKAIIFIPLLLCWNCRNTAQEIKFFFIGSAVGSIIGCIVAMYGYFILNVERAFPSPYMYIQAGDMSMTLGLFSLLGLFYKEKIQNKFYKWLLFFGFIGGTWGSILSGSRGGWLIFPIVLVIVAYCFRSYLSLRIISFSCIVIFTCLAVTIVIPQSGMWQRYLDAKYDITQYTIHNDANTSLGLRFNMWKGAVASIEERPLTGWGVTGAQEHKKVQYKNHILVKEAAQFTHVHNQLLNDWYERGILGLLTSIAILAVPGVWFIWGIKKFKVGSIPHLIGVVGVIHVLAIFTYGLSQGFLEHNSGSVFYFYVVLLIMSFMYSNVRNDT